MNILLLCDYQPRIAATVSDHLQALQTLSRHRMHRFSMLGELPDQLELERFDAVIVHYTLIACHERYLSQRARNRLSAFSGLKAIFIQDEYRHVNASIKAMREIGIHVLFTCVPSEQIEKVYSEAALPGVLKVNVLTGYVPDTLLSSDAPAPSKRALKVGYRGRKLPAWLGSLAKEKYEIGIRFREDAKRYPDLQCDISFREEDRLYGKDWTRFLTECRAVLGVESGASVFDFTGQIQRQVETAAEKQPALSYEALEARYFPGLDNSIKLAQISPRCFESAALRTVMVMYDGDYSGRLVPGRHYIALRKDHSNMDEVVQALRDGELCDRVAEWAREEVAMAPQNSYRAFIEIVDQALESAWQDSMRTQAEPYEQVELDRLGRTLRSSFQRRLMRQVFTYAHYTLFRVILGKTSPEFRERVHRRLRGLWHIVKPKPEAVNGK